MVRCHLPDAGRLSRSDSPGDTEMEPKEMSLQVQQSRENQEPSGPPICLVCGSFIIPLRGLLDCSLCCFVICEECEGGLFEN